MVRRCPAALWLWVWHLCGRLQVRQAGEWCWRGSYSSCIKRSNGNHVLSRSTAVSETQMQDVSTQGSLATATELSIAVDKDPWVKTSCVWVLLTFVFHLSKLVSAFFNAGSPYLVMRCIVRLWYILWHCLHGCLCILLYSYISYTQYILHVLCSSWCSVIAWVLQGVWICSFPTRENRSMF